jgi:hypothetical protein
MVIEMRKRNGLRSDGKWGGGRAWRGIYVSSRSLHKSCIN